MKATKHLLQTSVMLAVAGLLWLPVDASAQQGAGAAKLTQLKPIKTIEDAQAVKPGDSVVMSCPKCKDSWVTVVEKPVKQGATPETRTLLRHECPGCSSKLVTEGTGTNAHTRLVHVCKNCGSEDAFCCVMKKSAQKPTPGMEKK